MELATVWHIPYIGDIYPLENIGVKALTILLIVSLTAINYFSVNYGGALQRFLTILKALAIVMLIAGILFSGKGTMQHVHQTLPSMPHGWAMVGAYMAAISGAFWAYDGWNNISFVAGEVKIPSATFQEAYLLVLVFASWCILWLAWPISMCCPLVNWRHLP